MQTVAKTIVHVVVRLLVCAALTFNPAIGRAQQGGIQVVGRVVDALSGEPIGNARVEVTAQIASSDSSGHFRPGSCTTRLGFGVRAQVICRFVGRRE